MLADHSNTERNDMDNHGINMSRYSESHHEKWNLCHTFFFKSITLKIYVHVRTVNFNIFI